MIYNRGNSKGAIKKYWSSHKKIMLCSYYNVSYAKWRTGRISCWSCIITRYLNPRKYKSTLAWNHNIRFSYTLSWRWTAIVRNYSVRLVWIAMELHSWIYLNQYFRWAEIRSLSFRNWGNRRNLSAINRVFSAGITRNRVSIKRNTKKRSPWKVY